LLVTVAPLVANSTLFTVTPVGVLLATVPLVVVVVAAPSRAGVEPPPPQPDSANTVMVPRNIVLIYNFFILSSLFVGLPFMATLLN
jgi:hypothetical protein